MIRSKPPELIRLENILIRRGSGAVAVSGGVDSLTLAEVINLTFGEVQAFHAISPAVPTAATDRVRHYSKKGSWDLEVFDAGEFKDKNYLSNPYNRCYYCKSNLYQSISSRWSGRIFSGTNTDDLSDFRPGLEAATENSITHPYVEANISKAELRVISSFIGLDLIATLPASPCLSSRITTGISVELKDLYAIENIEIWLREKFEVENARCRRSEQGFYLELDADIVREFSQDDKDTIIKQIISLHPEIKITHIAEYRRGSAFIKVSHHAE